MSEFLVSVIIPAHNASETLADTFASLLAQTRSDWEAIIVDDGSTDGTAEIARGFAESGHPVRVIIQPQQGVCVARNNGIASARGDWVLFLDADDWIVPEYLERMLGVLQADLSLDAVHCGWCRVAPDGTRLTEKYGDPAVDLFPTLARHCPFAIHACVMRKTRIEAAGGFDTSLRICEDWDLWQRLARAGVRFGAVREVLALYRMRPGSLSRDPLQFYRDALVVLERGHGPDPRVSNPLPEHAQGRPPEELPLDRMLMVTWLAGLLLGEGKDARMLLEDFPVAPIPGIGAYWLADNLFEAAMLQDCRSRAAWVGRWPMIQGVLLEFLAAVEHRACALGLARRTAVLLERFVLEAAAATSLPVGIGSTYGLCLDITRPLEDVRVDPTFERLYCRVATDGDALGVMELPVCDGLIASEVLADAIAARFAWEILERFFQATVYRAVSPSPSPAQAPGGRWRRLLDAMLLRRSPNPVPLAVPETPPAHDEVGWQVFLQQLWDRSDWPQTAFYDADVAEPAAPERHAEGACLDAEISAPLPDVRIEGAALAVLLRVGGAPIARFTVPAVHGLVSAAALRCALLAETGFELCVAAVREGLVGQSWSDQRPLRERLIAAARRPANELTRPKGAGGGTAAPDPAGAVLVIGRRAGPIGSSVSRLARLPSVMADTMVQAAELAGEWIACRPKGGRQPQSVIYEPALMRAGDPLWPVPVPAGRVAVPVRAHDRGDFETLFARQPDPWKYTSHYEQTKYEQTLSLLPAGRIARALELACAEGHFTIQLADRVEQLVAADISRIALERTRERCRDRANIDFRRIDLASDPLPDQQDLIVCSEVLYYVGDRRRLEQVARNFCAALNPGGHVLLAHANAVIDEPDRPGFDWDIPYGARTIAEVFSDTPGLLLRSEIATPLYRIQLFQRAPEDMPAAAAEPPELLHFDIQPEDLPPEVAVHVLWQGGQPECHEPPPVVTKALPVLMYHRVAPGKADTMRRYRVSPEDFEEQLQYLRDAGFHSVGWAEWQAAAAARTPLPGRAIALTFDDGYQDVFDYAAPLLERYGFTATVFLVADRIGGSNVWDQAFAETIPLMGWAEIRELHARGLQFGSHTATHRALTGLSIAEVVDEGARSRAVIEDALRSPVRAVAYPYGDFDDPVAHVMGACGYLYGLSCRHGRARFGDSLLAVPRIEIEGTDRLRDFVAKLAG